MVNRFLAAFEVMAYGDQPINEMFSPLLDLKIHVFTEQFTIFTIVSQREYVVYKSSLVQKDC